MYSLCKKESWPSNVIFNPNTIEKKRYHGSLAHGILSNITYALNNLTFKYFIACSSRNMFANNLTLDALNHLVPYPEGTDENGRLAGIIPVQQWSSTWNWAPAVYNTKLIQFMKQQNGTFYSSPHEGLCFTYRGCKAIQQFFKEHPDIYEDCIHFNVPMEEFALQTILTYQKQPFYYIGNGCCNEDPIPPNTPGSPVQKFMYKVVRPSS